MGRRGEGGWWYGDGFERRGCDWLGGWLFLGLGTAVPVGRDVLGCGVIYIPQTQISGGDATDW